jgi:hypothetical protein
MCKEPDRFTLVQNELKIYEALSDLQDRCIPRILFTFNGFPIFHIGMSLVEGGEAIGPKTENL